MLRYSEPMPEKTGLRERKKAETRRRTEAAALELFTKSGFDGTTVEAIAAEADISPRTFFHYFDTKEDVLLADYSARLKRIVDQLTQRPAAEAPWLALRESFMVVAEDFDAEREPLVRRFMVMAGSPSVYARSLALQSGWEDAVARALAERTGVDPEDLEPRLMAASALAAMQASQRRWMATGQKVHLPELVAACFDQLAAGLISE